VSRNLCDSSSAEPPGFIDRWLDPARTGLASFDKITDEMGGAKAIHVEGILPSFCFVTVFYERPVNVAGVAREYDILRPEIHISELDLRTGDGDCVRIEARASVWVVRILAGWGDCLAGCINRHLWEFRYYPGTAKLQIVADSGPPLPARRDWD